MAIGRSFEKIYQFAHLYLKIEWCIILDKQNLFVPKEILT